MSGYILRVLIAIDQLANALIGGAPDETLSASAYIGEVQGKLLPRFFRPLIDWAFGLLGQHDHCRMAYFSEVMGAHLPTSYFPVKPGSPIDEPNQSQDHAVKNFEQERTKGAHAKNVRKFDSHQRTSP